MKPAMTPQQSVLTGEGAFSLYKRLVVGSKGTLLDLVHYEILTLGISNLPGLLGIGARALLYPGIFAACGKRPAIGKGVTLRNAKAIWIGNKTLIDDYATLDVRGDNGSIILGNFVSIGRFSTITSKEGKVILQDGSNIGSYCRIATQSKIDVGESTLIAAYSYIGPGNHQAGDGETPLIAREMDVRGGVVIGSRCWIGAGALILDGVTIGDGAVIGAQSLIREDVPPGALVVGTPGRVIESP